MSSVRLDVRAFFEYYERAAEDPDGGALSSCLCDVFMSLDPNSASALSRQALLAALPCRRALFQAIGSDGLELAAITETKPSRSPPCSCAINTAARGPWLLTASASTLRKPGAKAAESLQAAEPNSSRLETNCATKSRSCSRAGRITTSSVTSGL